MSSAAAWFNALTFSGALQPRFFYSNCGLLVVLWLFWSLQPFPFLVLFVTKTQHSLTLVTVSSLYPGLAIQWVLQLYKILCAVCQQCQLLAVCRDISLHAGSSEPHSSCFRQPSVLSVLILTSALGGDITVINSGERGRQGTEGQSRVGQREGCTKWEGSWKVQGKKLWIEVMEQRGAEIECEQEIRKRRSLGGWGGGRDNLKTAQNTEEETKRSPRS